MPIAAFLENEDRFCDLSVLPNLMGAILPLQMLARIKRPKTSYHASETIFHSGFANCGAIFEGTGSLEQG